MKKITMNLFMEITEFMYFFSNLFQYNYRALSPDNKTIHKTLAAGSLGSDSSSAIKFFKLS